MSANGGDLPTSWKPTCLGDLYVLNYGKALPKEARADGGQFPVFGSSGIVGSHSEYLAFGPAVIVGRKGAAGSVYYTEENFWPIDTTYFVKPPAGVDAKFAFHQLRSIQLDRLEKSTAIPGLSRDDAYALQVAIPPLNEQRRIVAKIEELFSELDKGVESLTAARQQLKAYRQSVLNRAVVGALPDSRAFSNERLSAVVNELGQGWSPRCLNHPSVDDETWAVITTTAIQHGAFRELENKQLPQQLEPRPHLAITVGDLLITRAGPRKRVGVACLVRHCRPRLMLCDKAYRLRADTDKVLPEWLELVLNSPSTLLDIERLKTGISDSGVNLTQNRFLELEVPIPTIAEQKAVLKVADSLTSQMTHLETQIETAMQQSNALRQSILKRAFSGKLVAQEASDEPAAVLLERIRRERDAVVPTRRRRVAS